jgi:hypothetical protein
MVTFWALGVISDLPAILKKDPSQDAWRRLKDSTHRIEHCHHCIGSRVLRLFL